MTAEMSVQIILALQLRDYIFENTLVRVLELVDSAKLSLADLKS